MKNSLSVICYTNVNTGTTYFITLVDVAINPVSLNQTMAFLHLHHALVHEEYQNTGIYTL